MISRILLRVRFLQKIKPRRESLPRCADTITPETNDSFPEILQITLAGYEAELEQLVIQRSRWYHLLWELTTEELILWDQNTWQDREGWYEAENNLHYRIPYLGRERALYAAYISGLDRRIFSLYSQSRAIQIALNVYELRHGLAVHILAEAFA